MQNLHKFKGKKTVTREILDYNLDAIISVGYRVNSKRGTQFRQWATQRLKDHLVKGYTLNEKRSQQVQQNMEQLQQAVKLIQQSGNTEQLSATEARGLLEIITNYTHSFILLNQFDSNNLPHEKLNENITYEIEYNEAIKAIGELTDGEKTGNNEKTHTFFEKYLITLVTRINYKKNLISLSSRQNENRIFQSLYPLYLHHSGAGPIHF